MDSTGVMHFDWTNILSDGQVYIVAWYADMDSSGAATGRPPVDRQRERRGRQPTPVTGDQAVVYDHDTNFAPIQACALF
ncbi:MAG: hypothetical protein H6735_04880 [Alphaproteobacteria bacterium]|nr:hypothetical protein [Alphaproteobacteria bacterium]